jgi:hypothetical protein
MKGASTTIAEQTADKMCPNLRIPFRSGSHKRTANGMFRFEDSPNIPPIADTFELLRNSLHMGHKPWTTKLYLIFWLTSSRGICHIWIDEALEILTFSRLGLSISRIRSRNSSHIVLCSFFSANHCTKTQYRVPLRVIHHRREMQCAVRLWTYFHITLELFFTCTITSMATLRTFEYISKEFNVEKICN